MRKLCLALLPIAIIAGLASCNSKPVALAAPFEGQWQVAFPGGPSVIVNKPITACENPVIISALSQSALLYASPKGRAIEFELLAFEGRTTWFPAVGPTYIAEVKDKDTFWLYSVSPIGKADWDNPKEYKRCIE